MPERRPYAAIANIVLQQRTGLNPTFFGRYRVLADARVLRR